MKNLGLITALWLLLCFPFTLSAGCWSDDAMADMEFAELDGLILLSFKDAVNCKPIRNAKIDLDGSILITNKKGEIKLPLERFEMMDDALLPMKISKEGYVTIKMKLEVITGSIWQKQFLLSPYTPIGQMRFVLQWGEKPRDLDLHLKGPGFHISYRNMKNRSSKAKLDRDALQGFGPETVTLEKIEDHKRYRVFVHRYSSTGKINSKGKLFVYRDNRLDRIVTLPETDKQYVDILTVDDHNLKYHVGAVDRID